MTDHEVTNAPAGGGRDRLRELLDAVLDESNRHLDDMADGAFVSPFHFSRQLTRHAGEAPVAMRRRVMLERAAWQLASGASVTDAAFAAGYDSVDGFARAFARAYGRPPSEHTESVGTWLPAPNGIHFHPPTSLWVDHADGDDRGAGEVTALLVEHDLDDVHLLLAAAKDLDRATLDAVELPDMHLLAWDGDDSSLGTVLEQLVTAKEVWLASILGEDTPTRPARPDIDALIARHRAVAPRWLAMVRDIDRRRAWGDRLVDALCDPPESFVLGSVLAHVLTFSAARRQLARHLLRRAGRLDPLAVTDLADPINWLRQGGTR